MATVKAAGATAEAVRQSVEQARNDMASAEANHRAAQTAPEQVAETQARTKSAEATVEQKCAALEQAKLNLHYTRVIAPVTGSVNKTVVLGMNVQPGQQLLTVVPLDDVWERQLRHLRQGQRVSIYVDSTGRTYFLLKTRPATTSRSFNGFPERSSSSPDRTTICCFDPT